MFILLFVRDEQSYDKYHEGYDRIYRIVRDDINNGKESEPYATTPRAMAFTVRTDLPEVEAAATLFQCRQLVFQHKDKQFYESRVFETDSNLFKVFTFPFVKGSAKEALLTPQSIIITESTARKYFDSEEAIGKQIQTEGTEYFVSGVIKDVPDNSHFKFDILIPLRTIEERFNAVWGPPNFYTYIKLRRSVDPISFESKLAAYASKKYERRPLDKFHTQALTEIHLNSRLKSELEVNGDSFVVRILLAIALFTIGMAAINYINLATARSIKRAKEVGIRKASGALQSGLIFQFLTESVMIVFSAFIVSFGLAVVFIGNFNQLAGKQLQLIKPELWLEWFFFGALAIAIGLIAGLYPAFYLASFNPVKVLKGNANLSPGGGLLRKGLVGIQFVTSMTLIIGTTVVVSQMNYIEKKDPGFEREQVIVVPNAGRLQDRSVLEQQISQLAGVEKVGASTSVIGVANWVGNIRTEGSEYDKSINFCQINYDYLDALGIRLLEGRQFSSEFPTDTINTIILNETAVRELKLNEPVGKRLVWDAGSLDTVLYAQVVGVVSDFHFASFHEPIKPFAFLIRNNFFVQDDFTSRLFVRTSIDPSEVVEKVEALWKQYVPQRPFSYTFLDDNFKNIHAEEERFKILFSTLTGLAIFIMCLGLFALIAFATAQRTKEIGIRKILGASVTSIVIMVNTDFVKLLMIASTIAFPIAIYFMNRWLSGFAYRIELEWWMFALAGMIALLIVFITTIYQSIRAGQANPVDSLRSE
jgi:putative ABC transport system permease protein